MIETFRMIIEQAKENGTYEQQMAAVDEYKMMHTAGIPNSCVLSKN